MNRWQGVGDRGAEPGRRTADQSSHDGVVQDEDGCPDNVRDGWPDSAAAPAERPFHAVKAAHGECRRPRLLLPGALPQRVQEGGRQGSSQRTPREWRVKGPRGRVPPPDYFLLVKINLQTNPLSQMENPVPRHRCRHHHLSQLQAKGDPVPRHRHRLHPVN